MVRTVLASFSDATPVAPPLLLVLVGIGVSLLPFVPEATRAFEQVVAFVGGRSEP